MTKSKEGRARRSACMLAVPFAFLAFVAALGACGAKPPKDRAPTSRITYLHYFSGSLRGGIDELVAAFNQANPGYELAATPLDHEAFKTSIVDSFKAGNPPDIYSYWAGAKTEDIRGELQPIDDLWREANLDSIFPKALADSACRYGGSHYLLPLTQHLVGFFYNKAAFAAAGAAPPMDWPSFLRVCARLKASGKTPIALGADAKWPAQFWFDYLLLRTAGPDYRDRLMAGEASWTDPEVARAFSLWKGLLDSGCFNKNPNESTWDSGAARDVAEGRAAMTLMGTWIIGSWNGMDLDWKEDEDYGFFPFPSVDPGTPGCALGPVDGVVIPRLAKNPEGAKRALRYLAEAVPQEAMSRGSGALAPSAAVAASSYTGIRRQVREVVAAAPRWAFNYDLAAPPEASAIGLDLFAAFLQFPGQYRALLERAEERTKALAGARSP